MNFYLIVRWCSALFDRRVIGLFERTLSRIQQTGTHRNRLRPSRPRDASRSPIDPLLTLDDGLEAHVVFVVQRPDVNRFRPYREVDHEFAALLAEVRATGVRRPRGCDGVRAATLPAVGPSTAGRCALNAAAGRYKRPDRCGTDLPA